MANPIAYKATSDPDTIYVDQTLRALDRKQFLEAMEKEVNDHSKCKHWEVIPHSAVPKGTKILPAVWSMKCKCHIASHKVYKWKAWLNEHGDKQEHGINY